MQLALIILFGLGVLLFSISFLAYAISAFRHHFVTGLIALLPVLNIITLPSLWHKSSRKFFVGFIGLVILSSSWFFGADQSVKNLVSRNSGSSSEKVIISTANNTSEGNLNASNMSESTLNKTKRTFSFNESNMVTLPKKALYRMQFDVVPINQISALQDRIVQITTTDNNFIEGRIKNIAPGSVILEGVFENELPIASIKQLKLMVKKAN